MKKKILYILSGLVILLLSVMASLPFLIKSEKIQEQIIQRIEQCYLVNASVKTVKLSYFPIPHINLFVVEVQHEQVQLTIPEIDIFPSWEIILARPKVGRIYIKSPQLTLLQYPDQDQKQQQKLQTLVLPDTLLEGTIFIENGTFSIPQITTESGVILNTSFTEVKAALISKNNALSLEWLSDSSFAENMGIKATISLDDFSTTGTLSLKHLDLSKVYHASPGFFFAIKSDTSDLSASFKYDNTNGFGLNFNGDVPDFTLTGPDLGDKPPVPFLIGHGNLNIQFTKDFFELNIESLEIKDPAVKLQGICSYYLPEDGIDKHVKLDLQGTNIDATSLRHKLLDLVGTNIVAETVCEIVQNGYANSASYYFDDTIPSFENINAMTINVDIERADIHLKYVPIDLQNAKGIIRIKDGDLTGWDITAGIGGSNGRNGRFLVGLGQEQWGLQVDCDIDADLSELPQTLRQIIPAKEITDELHLLSMQGRADAHLHIGEDLRDFKVTVDVNSFNNPVIRFARLSWPILPSSGQLQFTDTGANWQELALNVGNHIISETSGHISWINPAIPFELTSIKGIFDNNTILAELKSHEELKPTLDSVVRSIVGSTQLTGTIKGDFFSPENYIYSLDTIMKNMDIDSPRIPEKFSIGSARVQITDKTIGITESTGILLGDSLQINGNLNHVRLMNWTGDISFNGTVEDSLIGWIKKKEMLPEKMYINTPAIIDNMHIKWQENTLLVQGGVHPVDSQSTIKLKISQTDEILAGEFNITHGEDTALVRFFMEPLLKKYDFFMAGVLPGQALTDLFTDPFIQFKTISGKMNIHANFLMEETPPVIDFSGDLSLDKLNLLIDEQTSSNHTISFSVSGQNERLTINHFDINYNKEQLLTSGSFKHDKWNGYLHLNMESPAINTQTIEEITDKLNTFIYNRLGIEKKSAKNKSKYNLISEFDFNFQNFTVPFGEERNVEKDEKQYQFPITPLLGKYSFDSSNSELQINNSKVCGLEFDALLTWFGEEETSKQVSAQTPVDTVVEFRDFLECFNSNAVIEGPMTFKGYISTNKDDVKKGSFTLSSEKGHIYKFAAIAKAISILNIKGWSGSIWRKGFYYNELEISGTVENDVFKIKKFFLDGDGVDIVGKGTFNIDRMEYDMVFYVVPFASINSIVTKVPIVGRLLGGKEGRIISVPVKITGSAVDPEVSVMNAGEIGEATGKWILDTITIPFDWAIKTDPEIQSEQAIIPQGKQ